MSDTMNEFPNKTKKARLGRGIGSLLGGAESALNINEAAPAKAISLNPSSDALDPHRVWMIEIHKLEVNPRQPRQRFAKEHLAELANSIREKGILQPITARRLATGQLEIVAGERRWRAAQMAGLERVPVLIREMSHQESLELALIENIQRQELNAIEEAQAYLQLAKEFHLTQEQISQRVGKDRTTVANILRLLQLNQQVQQLVIEGKISMGHARALLPISDNIRQLEVARQVADGKLSVRATEKLASQIVRMSSQNGELDSQKPDLNTHLDTHADRHVSTHLDSQMSTHMDTHMDSQMNIQMSSQMDSHARGHSQHKKQVVALIEGLQKRIGTKIGLDYHQGSGKLTIHFYSDEQLSQLVERMGDAWLR